MKKKLPVVGILLVLVLAISLVEASCPNHKPAPIPKGQCAAEKINKLYNECAQPGNEMCDSGQTGPGVGIVQKCLSDAEKGKIDSLNGKDKYLSAALCTEAIHCIKAGTSMSPEFAMNLRKAIQTQGCVDSWQGTRFTQGLNALTGKDFAVLGSIGQFLSGIGAIMSGSGALWQANTASLDHDLKREMFEFDKWKYFNDQNKQNTQCGKNGVSPSGSKCADDMAVASTTTTGFGPSPTIFCDSQGNCQDVSKIPKQTNLVFATIHMKFPGTGNIFSLIQGVTNGIESFDGTGHVELDSNGITKMDIHFSEGQPIVDKKSQASWLLPGSTTYYGDGTPEPDIYETNTALWHLNSAVLVATTLNRDGDEFLRDMTSITGAQSYSPPLLTTGISFNHFGLPSYQNAMDISSNGDSITILTRGYIDAAIFGFGGYFPFVSRDILKGDSLIVKNRDMDVATGYVAKDGSFSYLIFPYDDSTKVTAQNSKVIQDSGGVSRILSGREHALVYGLGQAGFVPDPSLVFD